METTTVKESTNCCPVCGTNMKETPAYYFCEYCGTNISKNDDKNVGHE